MKPVITPFVPDTLSTEETKSFDIACQSTESRPAALMHWFLEQLNITSNSTSQSYNDKSTDKYSVTSNLKYGVDRSYNGQKILCRAVNIAGSMETSLTLYVKCKLLITKGITVLFSPKRCNNAFAKKQQMIICQTCQTTFYMKQLRKRKTKQHVLFRKPEMVQGGLTGFDPAHSMA